MEMQLVQERIANAAMELFAATCVLSRWDSELSTRGSNGQRRDRPFRGRSVRPARASQDAAFPPWPGRQ